MGAAVVYVGPSLRPGDLSLLDPRIEVRPPIRRGDLPSVVAAGYRFVGIIDGEFYQSLAVSPKEILAALYEGCSIAGGASMGALRAAEMAPYGMRGVGQIYTWFRRGDVSRDDDVAVSYAADEGDFRLLTVPMVNVKWVVQQARSQRWLSVSACRRTSLAARRIYWEDRTWRRVCAEAKLQADETRAILDYVADSDHDLKRLDALATIEHVHRMISDPLRQPAVTPSNHSS
jgi:hypothetical protein